MSKVKIDPKLVELFLQSWFEVTGEFIRHNEINMGWCYQFALVVQGIYGGELVTCSYYHAWVRIDGFNYDSDFLDGTKGNMNMPPSVIRDAEVVSEKEFRKIWNKIGNSGKVRQKVIDLTIKKFLKLKAA